MAVCLQSPPWEGWTQLWVDAQKLFIRCGRGGSQNHKVAHMELVYKVDDIQQAASALWSHIKDAKVFAFTGQMGAGKTTLIKALCAEIGVKNAVSSPTFSIINEYQSANGPVYHIDLYRCKNEDEVIRAGVEDCLYSGNICFVEWPSIAEGIFPKETIGISIIETDNNTRQINVNRKLYAQTIL